MLAEFRTNVGKTMGNVLKLNFWRSIFFVCAYKMIHCTHMGAEISTYLRN